jgi:hypothetical protein
MQHLRAARLAKRLKREAKEERPRREAEEEEEEEEYLPKELVARVDVSEEGGWEQEQQPEKENDSDSDSEDSEDEEDCEITDSEEQEPVEANTSALEILIASSQKHDAFDKTFFYQRGPEPTERTLQRRSQRERERKKAAENTPTLDTFFSTVPDRPATPVPPTLSTDERKQQERSAAITALEKKLASKKEGLAMNGQTLMRHQVVLAFLRVQQGKQLGETREFLATVIARSYGKGPSFARRIITWEIEWIEGRKIKEGRRGCYMKTRSWFKDEGVKQAVRDWLATRSGEGQYFFF